MGITLLTYKTFSKENMSDKRQPFIKRNYENH